MVVGSSDTAPLPETLMLFDGECAVCDATVQFVLDRPGGEHIHFAPLQGSTAREILDRHPELPGNLDSVVVVQQTADGERVVVHSHAIFHLAGEMGGPWRVFGVLRYVPRVITDPAYKAFAAMRYRLFGTLEQCRMPKPEEAARFLP